MRKQREFETIHGRSDEENACLHLQSNKYLMMYIIDELIQAFF